MIVSDYIVTAYLHVIDILSYLLIVVVIESPYILTTRVDCSSFAGFSLQSSLRPSRLCTTAEQFLGFILLLHEFDFNTCDWFVTAMFNSRFFNIYLSLYFWPFSSQQKLVFNHLTLLSCFCSYSSPEFTFPDLCVCCTFPYARRI